MSAQKRSREQDEKETHEVYWERLAKAEPNEVCQRTEAVYIPERGGYALPILTQRYLVSPKEKKIFCLRGDFCEEEDLRDHFFLMVLLYLLEAEPVEPARTWISEKDLKGGTTFFRGPHALSIKDLEKTFGKNPEDFWQAGQRLGGIELLFGDRAFALPVFSKVPIGYVLWKEDEEFPPRITVMFDSTIQKHFSLDGIWCLVDEVSTRLLEARKP